MNLLDTRRLGFFFHAYYGPFILQCYIVAGIGLTS
mgnify:CR=1 FL=1